MANSIGRGLAPAGEKNRLVAQSELGASNWIRASAGSASRYDDSPLGNGYTVQASGDDVVVCSFVGKVVMCHRIVRSRPPRLLLPYRLPREQQRNKPLLGPSWC
jgi:hypothetical protein